MKDTNKQMHLILVGYRLRPVDYFDQLVAKDDLCNKLRANALTNVYLSTFDEVYVSIPSLKKARHFTRGDQPICLALREFLLKLFPDAWSDDVYPLRGKPEAIFVGFEPRFFLKLLGLECSLPLYNQPLPVAMWYGNSDHRDITEAVMPKSESKAIDWPHVIAARGLGLEGEDKCRYDELVKGWEGPGMEPQRDVDIAFLFAVQLGFVKL